MIKVNFTPQTDIETYLNNDFNIEIFNNLNENEDWQGTFEPLEFLNLLYEQFEIVNANKAKPISVKKHLLNLDLKQHQLYYLLSFLKHLIYSKAGFQTGGEPKDKPLSICHDFIEKEYYKLERELFPKDETETEKPVNKYDFERVKEHLETLPETKAKIKYLIEIKTEYKQNTPDWDVWEYNKGNTFDAKCDLEISKIKNLLSLEQPATQPKAKPQLGGYTNSQLVLIFYYFFKQNGLEPRVSIDISPMAKFIHLITGREFKAVTSSDFYKKLQAVPNFKTDRELIKDLEDIKPLFKMVQLNEVVRMIENEIDLARNGMKQAKKK